ncbi:MAG: type II secretion system F family protein [Opitutaceae bacterium]
MARFAYSGRDRAGAPVAGDVEAPSRRDAVRILAARGFHISRMSEPAGGKPPEPKAAPARVRPPAPNGKPAPARGGGFSWSLSGTDPTTPRRAERLPFLEALYDLTSSGLSAGEAVRLLSVRLKDPRLHRLSAALWEQLSEGSPLSRAMSAQEDVFDGATINLIQAGEATGSLNETLARIIAHLTERREVQRQLLAALAYPVFMVVVAAGVILFFLFFLLPRLQTLLTSLGGEMPISTRILIGGSTFMLHYGIFVFIALALLGVSFWRWRQTEAGRNTTDAWMLKLPLVGPFAASRTVLEFSQNLSVLLENGITASEALRMTVRQITNRVHQRAFEEATGRVLEGEALSQAVGRTGVFPDLVLDRLSVGENTGNVVPSLREIGKSHRKLLSRRLNLFTSAIATAVLFCVFAFVGFIAFAIVMAVFQVSASFK